MRIYSRPLQTAMSSLCGVWVNTASSLSALSAYRPPKVQAYTRQGKVHLRTRSTVNYTLREYSRNVVIGYSLSSVNINIYIYINVAYSVPFRFPASSIVGLGLGLVVGLGTVLVLFFFAFSPYQCMLKGRKLRPHQVPTPWHSG